MSSDQFKDNKIKFLQKLKETNRTSLIPKDKIPLHEWVTKYYYLSPSISPDRPGTFRPDVYQLEPLRAMSDERVKLVVLASSAQMLKTTLLRGFYLWMIDQCPAPTLLAVPVKAQVERECKLWYELVQPNERIKPLISTEGKNKSTERRKLFAAGFLEIGSFSSSVFTSSVTARYVLIDEADRDNGYNRDGNPIKLLTDRQSALQGTKTILCSTPTTTENHIWSTLQTTSFHQPYINCPYCQAQHRLSFDGKEENTGKVFWDEDDDGNITDCGYVCPNGCIYTEAEKNVQVRTTFEWIPKNPHIKDRIGFGNLSQLYSPRKELQDIIHDFKQAKNNQDDLRVFLNTTLGEPFIPATTSTDALKHKLQHLVKSFDQYSIPTDTLIITAATDVQADRLETSFYGWNSEGQRYLLLHHILQGQTDGTTVWEDYEEHLRTIHFIRDGDNRIMRPARTHIDIGFRTNTVLYRIKPLRYLNVFPTRGSTSSTAPIYKQTGTGHWHGSIMGKDSVYRAIQDQKIFLYSDVTDEIVAQLTAEKRTVKNGKVKFELTRKRNECLDCAVMAESCLYATKLNLSDKSIQRLLENRNYDKEPIKPRRQHHEVSTPANTKRTQLQRMKDEIKQGLL